jgi:hypothetical protein
VQRKAISEALHRMLTFAELEGVPRRGIVVDVDAVSLM